MDKIIPTISSGTEGPLGVVHLPRLWLKTLLSAYDRLPTGYKDIQPGFDFMVLEGLGIEPEAARDYIKTVRPSYLQFESWIKSQPNVDLSAENIVRINEMVRERKKGDDARRKLLAENGLPDDGTIINSIMLNNLDDWREIYQLLKDQPR